MMNDERAMLNELIETYTTDVQQGSLADRNASSRALDDSLDRIIAERDAEIARLDARVTQLHGRATKAEAERDAAREALRRIATSSQVWTREQMIDEAAAALASPPERPRSYTDGVGTFNHADDCGFSSDGRCTCWPPERPNECPTCGSEHRVVAWLGGGCMDPWHQGEQEKS